MGADMHIWKVQYFYRNRQRHSRKSFSAAAQNAAALFVSTYFYPFPQYSTKYSYERVPEVKQVRAFFISERRTSLSDFFLVGGTPGCRSPPSDFDFAYQLKKSKLEDDL